MAKRWTVMVFMGANNAEGEADLRKEAEKDLKEMEAVGSNDLLDIVVQIDRKRGPQRFHILKGHRKALPLPPGSDGNTGNGDVLKEFVQWVQHSRYQSPHYLLVLWGHAYRLAFERDGRDAMDFPELAAVLRQTRKIDIVGFDACGMSLVEGAYQLRGAVDYLVASQVDVPLPGWQYKLILERVAKDRKMRARDLGALIVRRFVEFYTEDSVTMTMLDVTQGDDIGPRVADLTHQLLAAIAADYAELDRVVSAFGRCRVADDQLAIDLATFCWIVMTETNHLGVKRAARELGDLLINPLTPLVREHARSNLNVAMPQGVSIFAPNIEHTRNLDELRHRYDALDLARDTDWGTLTFALAEPN